MKNYTGKLHVFLTLAFLVGLALVVAGGSHWNVVTDGSHWNAIADGSHWNVIVDGSHWN